MDKTEHRQTKKTQSSKATPPPSSPAIDALTLALPKGGGAIQSMGQTFQADEFTGTAALSVPISVTPCRQAQPILSLNYHSGSGNGAFGMGFNLSMANISRHTTKSIPTYTDADDFVLSEAEVLVPVQSKEQELQGVMYQVTNYRPRLENVFASIEYWRPANPAQAFWRVITKEHLVHIYGKTAQAKIVDSNNPSHIFTWLLEEVVDTKGNHTLYQYKQENTDNVPQKCYEEHRAHTNQRYLKQILYGNTQADEQPYLLTNTLKDPFDKQHWHFLVVLDYGEHLSAEKENRRYHYEEQQLWRCRQDPFSQFQAGFEIRTHRLCRALLMFHHFPEEWGEAPVLVKATECHYQENPRLSQLIGLQATGYHLDVTTHTTESQATPMVNFQYTPFTPTQSNYQPIFQRENEPFSGLNQAPNYMLVDLYGEGIPGVLYTDEASVLYWEPVQPQLSNTALANKPLAYGEAKQPLSFPIHRQVQSHGATLTDIDGNGKIDLMINSPIMRGFYECQPDKHWDNFQAFQKNPTDLNNPRSYWVDMTGSGLADRVFLDETQLTIYPALGKEGFDYGQLYPRIEDLPIHSSSEQCLVQFMDILGSGRQHLVRVSNGKIECWPNLGYGRFGKKFELANVPDWGVQFDIARLHFADTDGSGTLDMLYFYHDHVCLYLNNSGNSFDGPIKLPLPCPYDQLSQISFADIFGRGHQCLVITKPYPTPQHWCFDFCETGKPYLLNHMDNNQGAITTIHYTSSTQFYLADKARGESWKTFLPFPVQVVEKIQTQDAISGYTFSQRFVYHQGDYDGFEREFCGFGFVERIDSETFTETQAPSCPYVNPHEVPPVCTKTWYHTGTDVGQTTVSQQFQDAYYPGDKNAFAMADSQINYHGAIVDSKTRQQAYRTLKGQTLRQEIYALDGTDKQSMPYLVTESNYQVNLRQAPQEKHYAVFTLDPQQTLTYHYERDPIDPRIIQEYTLEVDEMGDIIKSCQIAYARRPTEKNVDNTLLKAQRQNKITFSYQRYIEPDTHSETYLGGVPLQMQQFELHDLQDKDHIDFDSIKKAVDGALAQSPASSHATLLAWERYYYTSPERNGSNEEALLPFGQVTLQCLLGQVNTLNFSKPIIENLFEEILAAEELKTTLLQGGYVFEDENSGYWQPGLRAVYQEASGFYALSATVDPFDNTTHYEYDRYQLLLQRSIDPLNNINSIEGMDYQHMQPTKIRDANGNSSEAFVDALGSVIVTTYYGSESGTSVGFAPLSDYQRLARPTLENVLAAPESYLQQAASYFYYDYFAWQTRREPSVVVSLQAEQYPNSLGNNTRIQQQLTYSDGFGRELQSKVKADAGEAFVVDEEGHLKTQPSDNRWLTSGSVVYNNKGAPIKQYEPYYMDGAAYVEHALLNERGVSETLFYDPLERVFRTETAKGFYRKVTFTPWLQKQFDENDTLLDSHYYQNLPQDISQEEQTALHKATLFYNTPQVQCVDNLGHIIVDTQINEGLVTVDSFATIENMDEVKAQALVQELTRSHFLDFRCALTFKFQPSREDFTLELSEAFAAMEPAIIKALEKVQKQGQQLNTVLTYDIQGHQLSSSDARLAKLNQNNLETDYSLTGEPLRVNSVDAGRHWALNNVMGNPLFQRDSRGFITRYSYDALQRPTAIQIQGGDGKTSQNFTAQRFIYGDSVDETGKPYLEHPNEMNARGQLYQTYDSSGLQTIDGYSITGQPLEMTQQFCKAYKTLPDWQTFGSNLLQETSYKTRYIYDALDRIIEEIRPDKKIYRPCYNALGQLIRVSLQTNEREEIYVDDIQYNEKGQRLFIQYGNGVKTAYEYDSKTYELTRLCSCRTTGVDTKVLQDIQYTYDPVGNITHITDKTLETIYYNNQQIDPGCDYTYDAVYQLIKARGREHIGLTQTKSPPQSHTDLLAHLPGSNDEQALQTYTRTYCYDEGHNLFQLRHQAEKNAFTRNLVVSNQSNRAVLQNKEHSINPEQVDTYFDGNGNQIQFNAGNPIEWNYHNHIHKVVIINRVSGEQDAEYYIYNSAGERVRKVSESYGSDGAVRHVNETLYLGHVEIRRVLQNDTLKEEIHLHRIMDDTRCIANRYEWVVGSQLKECEALQYRYQLENHLGSATVEVNQEGQVISYEEYYPYGGTSFIAGRSSAEVKLKFYRYSGKERDNTGLYYYGARYYAPWLGRWLSPDPAGTVDGLNLYGFVGGNPITFIDDVGMMAKKSKSKASKIPKIPLNTNTNKKITKQQYTTPPRQSTRIADKKAEEQKKLPPAPTNTIGHFVSGKERTSSNQCILENKKYAINYTNNLFNNDITNGVTIPNSLKQQLLDHAKKYFNPQKKDFHSALDTNNRIITVLNKVNINTQNDRSNLPNPGGLKKFHDRGHLATNRLLNTNDIIIGNGLRNIVAEHNKVNQGLKVGFENAVFNYKKNNQSEEIFTYHGCIYNDNNRIAKKPNAIVHIAFTDKKILSAMTFSNSKKVIGDDQRW